METKGKTRLILIALMAMFTITGCGKKDDLFLPEENAAVSSSQQPQADKEQKKKQPATEN